MAASPNHFRTRQKFKFIPDFAPKFGKNETLDSLIAHIELWVENFSRYPVKTTPRDLVAFVSSEAWIALRPYFRPELDTVFETDSQTFRKYEDLYSWLLEHQSYFNTSSGKCQKPHQRNNNRSKNRNKREPHEPLIPHSITDINADMLAIIQAKIERVPPPSSDYDFFIYEHDLRTILAMDERTLWLVHPTTDEWDPVHVAWSRVASRAIWARIPLHVQPDVPWPSTTFEVLQMLQRQSPTHLSTRTKFKYIPDAAPRFRQNEPLVSLVARIILWLEAFSISKYPVETAPPALVSFVSYLCWPALRSYFKEELDPVFAKALSGFKKFEDLYNWLFEHQSFLAPTPPRQKVVGALQSLYVEPPIKTSSGKSRNSKQGNNNQGKNSNKRKPNKPSSSNKGAFQ